LLQALRVVSSTISKCEKIQLKFANGTSQHTLLKNRIKAMYIAWSKLEGRLSDFNTDTILGNSEENGKLVITATSPMFGRNSEGGAYYAVEIVIDSNTKVYKRIARGYVGLRGMSC
jgi:hypothetical protein